MELLRLLHELDAARVTNRLLDLRFDLSGVPHQDAVEQVDLAAAPAFVIAIQEASGVKQ